LCFALGNLQRADCSWQRAVGKGQFAISSLQFAKKLCVNSALSFLYGENQFAMGKEQMAKISA
jgi:hypothetical protein